MAGPQTTVAQGELIGRTATSPGGKTYHAFQGIPYAKPPIGSLRFKDPQPAERWDGVRDATTEGNKCAQIDVFFSNQFEGGEDCLYLNVYTPNLHTFTPKIPVMVWFHGGSFTMGSGNTDLHGPDFFIEKDVVLVTINYRVNVLGFLCLNTPEVPGNAGLKDQVFALQWIKENIDNFGGNPNNVTVFGSSAGAGSISALNVSPLADDLYHKTILQSGTSIGDMFHVHRDPVVTAKRLAKTLDCESDDLNVVLELLQTVPVKDLVFAASAMKTKEERKSIRSLFTPVVEKEFSGVDAFLTKHPEELLKDGQLKKVPTIIGYNSLEAAKFLGAGSGDILFENEFRTFIPKTFNVEWNSNKAIEIANKIRKFYFGDAKIGTETIKQYIDLISDVVFVRDIHRYLNYLVNSMSEPVYLYRFSYFGEINLFRKYVAGYGLQGACHSDEWAYQFQVAYQKDTVLSRSDRRVREQLTTLWSNFAKCGNPIPEESNLLNTAWLPVTKEKKYFLDIGQDLVLSTNPDKSRVEFWNTLFREYPNTFGQDPQPAEPWEGVREVTVEGNKAPQIDDLFGNATYEGGEDCLFLNIYTPNIDPEAKLPVLIWFHGGNFQLGSGNSDIQGPDYLIEKDVILVTVNYRLGALGFMCLHTAEIPGNAGLKDQALSLKWLYENIASFGGDQNNFTVFGFSAGGAAATFLTASPLSKQYVNKVIAQSGTVLTTQINPDPLENARSIAKAAGCDSDDIEDIAVFLQTVQAQELIETVYKNRVLEALTFSPVIEKEFAGVQAFITEPPLDYLTEGRVCDVPTMIGYNYYEALIYGAIPSAIESFYADDLRSVIPKEFNIPFDSEEALKLGEEIKKFYYGDAHIGAETLEQGIQLKSDVSVRDIHRYAKYLLKQNTQPVYFYRFSYFGNLNYFKKFAELFGLEAAGHGDELGYMFSSDALKDVKTSEDDARMREVFITLITNFAKTGNPTPEETELLPVKWIPMTENVQYFLDINNSLSLSTNLDRMDFWDSLYDIYFTINKYHQYYKKQPRHSIGAIEKVHLPPQEVQTQNGDPEIVEPGTEDPEIITNGTYEDEEDSGISRQDTSSEVEAEKSIDAPEVTSIKIEERQFIEPRVDEPVKIAAPAMVFEPVKLAEPVEQMKVTNGAAKDIIRANDPPEDDLPKNIGVNKFVNFFESLGNKKAN